MILPINASASQPVAYSGGQASTSKPSFGASLQATLAQLQATNHGLTSGATVQHAHHGHGNAPFQGQNPFGGGSASGSASGSGMTLPAL
ncbi:MAG: hypothetical protein PHT60_03260 [Acidiphilium sp.]|nr:hypothetical protein [Acidiphilium sp.]MDD4934775.1 hypothetical protein [Acidiphilium sp.]